jgi:hypothetical protein
MGTPVEPIEYGNDCLLCFDPSTTPKKIRATFSGIECCPGLDGILPNNTVFILNQSPGDPCAWYNFDYTNLYVAFWVREPFSYLAVNRLVDPIGFVFAGEGTTPCSLSFSNALECPGNNTTGGVGHVWYEPDNWPEVLANIYNFCPGPGTLFDRTPCTNLDQIIKLANRRDKTNILIRHETEILMTGMILIWSGAVGDIPGGWHLCDGTEGTPDLTDKFIIGAGSTYAPDYSFTTNLEPNASITAYSLCYIMKL